MEYRIEANLPIPTTENAHLVADTLILFNVIEKRRGELDDFAKGMESISLISYLRQNKQIGSLLFPRSAEKIIDVTTLKSIINKDGEFNSLEQRAEQFLLQYIDELGKRDPTGQIQYDWYKSQVI